MKYENGLFWPDSETHLNSFGLNYQKGIRDVGISLVNKNKRTLAVDIGAHVGIATLHFASEFKNVISFEPIKETFECLQKNTENLSNISAYNLALADKERLVDFNLHQGNTGYTEPKLVGDSSATCTAETLDSVLNGLKPSLIKIDVEGFEPLVLKGALKTINSSKPIIIMEVKGIGFSKPDPYQSIRILSEFNYVVVAQDSHDVVMAPRDLVLNKDA